MTHIYNISGMDCEGCSYKVKHLLEKVAGVESAKVDLQHQQAEVTMHHHIATNNLQAALSGTKYSIAEQGISAANPVAETEEPVTLKTYMPIFLIFGYITAATFLVQFIHGSFNLAEWMRHFMAGFFLTFSFFKLLDVSGFAASYSTYDIVAKRWVTYGYIYPFIELALGISFLIPALSTITSIATLAVMTVSITGVIQSMLQKRNFQCACLGAIFKLPLSKVTLVEDGLMIVMSIAALIIQ